MIVSKKQISKLFFDYTKIIYNECGRPLSKAQEFKLKSRINNIVQKYTLKEKIKEAFKRCKK